MAPKGTFVDKNQHVKLRARLTSFVPLDPNSVSVKTDVIWRQRTWFCVPKRSRTQKFMFSHCQSVSNFSKKWEKIITSHSKIFCILFVKVFEKCIKFLAAFSIFYWHHFSHFSILLEHMGPKTMSRMLAERHETLVFRGWRMDTTIYRLPAQKPLRGNNHIEIDREPNLKSDQSFRFSPGGAENCEKSKVTKISLNMIVSKYELPTFLRFTNKSFCALFKT